jgi:hypothetical protein
LETILSKLFLFSPLVRRYARLPWEETYGVQIRHMWSYAAFSGIAVASGARLHPEKESQSCHLCNEGCTAQLVPTGCWKLAGHASMCDWKWGFMEKKVKIQLLHVNFLDRVEIPPIHN